MIPISLVIELIYNINEHKQNGWPNIRIESFNNQSHDDFEMYELALISSEL